MYSYADHPHPHMPHLPSYGINIFPHEPMLEIMPKPVLENQI